MKRLGLLLAIMCMFGVVANAQQDFQKGNCILNAGVGVGYGVPVSVSAEWPVATNMIKGRNGAIGIGPYIGFNLPCIDRNMGFDLGFRGAFHYQWPEKLDTYAGLNLSFHGYNDKDVDEFKSGVACSLFVGARYYFWNKVGLFAEIGGGLNFGALSIGACFKL